MALHCLNLWKAPQRDSKQPKASIPVFSLAGADFCNAKTIRRYCMALVVADRIDVVLLCTDAAASHHFVYFCSF